MRRLIIGTLCVLWASSGIVMAQGAKDTSVDKIKSQRAALLVKIPVLNDAFDHEHNGVTTSGAAFSRKYQAVWASLREKLEIENAKAGDARDQLAITTLQAKQQSVSAALSDRSSSASAQAWGQKFNELNTTRMNLTQLVTVQTANDQLWLRAGCDPALFAAVLTELNKRVDELTEQANVHIAEWQKRTEADLAKMQD